jgi:hypothetical protein
MAGEWTEERRQAAAARCRANKPWTQSTGPKTVEGKIRSSYNALKTGEFSVDFRHAHQMIKLNALFLAELELFAQYDLKRLETKEEILEKNELIKIQNALMPKPLRVNKNGGVSGG